MKPAPGHFRDSGWQAGLGESEITLPKRIPCFSSPSQSKLVIERTGIFCSFRFEQPYFLFNGVLLPRERLPAILCIELSIGEGLAVDRIFNCFGFFASRLLRF
jgi:hypothetical protein